MRGVADAGIYSDLSTTGSSNSSTSETGSNYVHPTLDTTVSSSVFMLDPRGSFQGTSESTPEMDRAVAAAAAAAVVGINTQHTSWPGTISTNILADPSGRSDRALAVSQLVENPGYETDTSSSRRTPSSKSTRTASDLSTVSSRSPMLGRVTDRSDSNLSRDEDEGRSSDYSLTSVSSLSVVSSPAHFLVARKADNTKKLNKNQPQT